MDISSELKQKFIDRDGTKVLTLYFPELNLTIGGGHMYDDSMSLEESLLDGSSIEFVGCLSSAFSIELHDISASLKGKRIEGSITIEGFEEEIPLFNGYVDSVKTRLEDSWKSITCYDDLYYKAGDVDIAGWYNTLLPTDSSTVSMLNFRNSLFQYLDIEQEEIELPNDDVVIKREYEPRTLNALKTLKSICQLNGVFGIMNRDGIFEYRKLSGVTYSLHPSEETLPGEDVFPGDVSDVEESIDLYMDMKYEDFDVCAIDKVLLRDSEDDAGVSYGSGTNTYIVQNNMFIYGLDATTKANIAKEIYKNVAGFGYKPFDATNIGYPFLEVGTKIKYMVQNYTSGSGALVEVSSFVLNRKLKGIQQLKDSYSAAGEEFQKAFITDIQTQLDTIKRNSINPDSVYTKQDMDTMLESYMPTAGAEEMVTDITDTALSQITQPTGLAFESVYTAPSAPRANTLYGVQCGVITVS